MRNLKLQHCKQIAAESVANGKFMLLDPNASGSSHLCYIVTENKLHAYNISTGSIDDLCEVPGIIGCEYLALDNEICVATDVGEVLLVNPQTKATNEGTYCDVGIKRMAWSPDQEVVAFVTKTHNVVVMTCTFEPLAEQPLSDQFFGEGQFITVGWGKKETQFHGSEGKMVAKQKNDFKPLTQIESLVQDIDISWRADAAYFAVSIVNAQVGRTFKVFDKEGRLKYTAENLNQLQTPIAWRPTGTWIAMPQQFPNKSTIALFEKNGLRHREIVLPFSLVDESVVALQWSLDSDIFSVETKNVAGDVNNLYLYTIGNYHWYLKQVLTFKLDDKIAVCTWDNRIGEEKTLHVLLESGKYLVYRWNFVINNYKRSGIVAVIDGKKLLMTNFAKTLMPPPMCNKELEIDAYVNSCGFIENAEKELLLYACDVAQNVHIFKANSSNIISFDKITTLQPEDKLLNTPLILANITWFNETHLIATKTQSNTTKIYYISTVEKPQFYTLEDSVEISGTVTALARGSSEMDLFFVVTNCGSLQQIGICSNNNIKLEQRFTHFDTGAVDNLHWFSTRSLESSGLITLHTNQCLYIDKQRIAGDVTSFCLAGNFLAFTKLTTLHFLRLADQQIVSDRKIERGGKLVTTISNDARIVLQMPRGNLEAICPRVLALEIIGTLLGLRRYNAAMDMLRKQRINLNIICDHNMINFMDDLEIFLQEITNPNWLNLFLSDLKNEDFTKTMYASNYKEGSQQYPEGFKIGDKILYLCEKLCELMEQSVETRFRLPIITAYVKIGKLEKALEIIWQEKQHESLPNATTKHAEEALKYLLYLVDINELYNVALGTYDFGLVLFVAQKSQKDPKEFLPFLNELKSFELNYRKFKIDEHLKRYEKALHNIAKCGQEKFNEALDFIKRHALYQEGLSFYKEQNESYQQICLAFADYLRSNGKLENASIMYERGENLAQALLSAKNVLDWRRVLALAKRDGQNLENVAQSLVPALQENSKYADAFELLKMYGNNISVALQCLLKGKLFLNAIFEARMQQFPDNEELLATVIAPHLMSYRSLLETCLSADQERFINYKQRLLAIRIQKEKQKQLDEDCDVNNVNIDECDLLSDTTSMNSSRYTGSSRGSTGKTFRSSKNRRKHERKLLSLKQGNPFEDIALIDALHNHIMKIIAEQQHIRDTCKALMELQYDVAASGIQQRFKRLLNMIQESLDEIWIPEIMTTQQFLTGPNIDYAQLQNEQRYAMINPQKRFKPQLNIIDWEHEILRS